MNYKHPPTDEQDAIISAVADPSVGSVMTEAYAGCAKSTTLEMAAPMVKVPAVALAFNKTIAQDLVKAMPANFTVKTFNGLGHGAWMRANPGVSKWNLDERKLGKIISQIAKDRKTSLSSDGWDQIRQITTKAMMSGISLGNIGTPLMEDIPENWLNIADNAWVHRDDSELFIDIAREALLVDVQLARQGTISFDDQVYCSAVLGGKFARYPVCFADEAQDLSPLNHQMIKHSVTQDGRIIAVGDSRQAIYAFRGADSRSMGNMRQLQTRWTDRRLTLTFRCPKAVVARQQDHAPGYRAAQGNRDGRFVHWQEPTGDQALIWAGWNYQDLAREKIGTQDTIAVLCRNNAPIMSLAFKFIRSGVGCMVLGRDLGKGLQALLKKICPEDHEGAVQVMGKVTDWMKREIDLALANGKDERVAGIEDKGESLIACLEGSGARTAGELKQIIKDLFEKEAGQVVLSTIHRAKGLEWDVVVHLDPWRIPSKWAKKAAQAGDDSQLTQEYNLRYVCETRTKHTLINANLEDFNG